jgi:hypothetical protein
VRATAGGTALPPPGTTRPTTPPNLCSENTFACCGRCALWQIASCAGFSDSFYLWTSLVQYIFPSCLPARVVWSEPSQSAYHNPELPVWPCYRMPPGRIWGFPSLSPQRGGVVECPQRSSGDPWRVTPGACFQSCRCSLSRLDSIWRIRAPDVSLGDSKHRQFNAESTECGRPNNV